MEIGVRAPIFLSTLSLRRATSRVTVEYTPSSISIHALLAESDGPQNHQGAFRYHFYPRSPCGERRRNLFAVVDVLPISIHALLAESDTTPSKAANASTLFLSTLSLRRATPSASRPSIPAFNFYPRSPCGERLNVGTNSAGFNVISIHALLAESDSIFVHLQINMSNFYPRSPCGERPLSIV